MKTQKLKLTFLFCLIILGVVITSCKKDTEQNVKNNDSTLTTKQISITQPMLKFSTYDEYQKMLDKINSLPDIEKSRYFDGSGVKTLLSKYSDFVDEVNAAIDENSEENVQKVVGKYNSILVIAGDKVGLGKISQRIVGIVNSEGMVEVQGEILYFDREGAKFTFHGTDASEFVKLFNAGIKTESITKFQMISQKSTCIICGDGQGPKTVYSPDATRRGTFESYIDFDYVVNGCANPGYYKIFSNTISYGFAEKRFANLWYDYKTINTIDLHFKARCNYDPSWSIVKNDYWQDTDEWYSVTRTWLIHQENCWNLQDIQSFNGIFLYMNPNRYTNRGMDGRWVTFNCTTNP